MDHLNLVSGSLAISVVVLRAACDLGFKSLCSHGFRCFGRGLLTESRFGTALAISLQGIRRENSSGGVHLW